MTQSRYFEISAESASPTESCTPSRTASGRHHVGRRVRRVVRLLEESVDALRINLLLTNHPQPFRVLAVTSATKGEGKTRLITPSLRWNIRPGAYMDASYVIQQTLDAPQTSDARIASASLNISF